MHRQAGSWRALAVVPLRLWAACVLSVAGCGLEPKGGPSPSPIRGVSPFEPVSIEVHPLTRVVEGAGGVSIDAHVSLRDETGDDVKGAGRLVFELYRESGPVEGIGERMQIRRWEADLSDAEQNSRAYDRVTRTYRFELSGVPSLNAMGGALTLRIVFTRHDRRQMSAERRLEPGGW